MTVHGLPIQERLTPLQRERPTIHGRWDNQCQQEATPRRANDRGHGTERLVSMQAESNPRPARWRTGIPPLSRISAAWLDMLATFPRNTAPVAGGERPFCFRCGWFAPTPSIDDYSPKRPHEQRFDLAWNAAGGWLEKAHLQDHAHGGSSDPLNMVPMCVLCHEEQPQCPTRDAGIDYVNSPSRFAPLLWVAQSVTDNLWHGVKCPGKSDAIRHLLRAYAEAGLIWRNAHEETMKGL